MRVARWFCGCRGIGTVARVHWQTSAAGLRSLHHYAAANETSRRDRMCGDGKCMGLSQSCQGLRYLRQIKAKTEARGELMLTNVWCELLWNFMVYEWIWEGCPSVWRQMSIGIFIPVLGVIGRQFQGCGRLCQPRACLQPAGREDASPTLAS